MFRGLMKLKMNCQAVRGKEMFVSSLNGVCKLLVPPIDRLT